MKTIFLLFVSSSLVLGAPRRPINTYDQRQDGSVNVHAKLDNFMFVFVPSSGIVNDVAELVDPIVAAALNLKNVDSRTATQSEIADDRSPVPVPAAAAKVDSAITRISSEDSSKMNLEDEESKVKIIAIVKEDIPEAVASQPSVTSLQDNKNKNLNVNVNVDPEKSEVHSKKARSLKNRSPESLSSSKLPPKSSGSEPLENKVAGISGKDRGNDVGSAEREPQLLGGGIENCGPGRFRNRLGVCQFRVDA